MPNHNAWIHYVFFALVALMLFGSCLGGGEDDNTEPVNLEKRP